MILISMRRFKLIPAFVLFEATGLSSPYAFTLRREAAIPFFTKNFAAPCALKREAFKLFFDVPKAS